MHIFFFHFNTNNKKSSRAAMHFCDITFIVIHFISSWRHEFFLHESQLKLLYFVAIYFLHVYVSCSFVLIWFFSCKNVLDLFRCLFPCMYLQFICLAEFLFCGFWWGLKGWKIMNEIDGRNWEVFVDIWWKFRAFLKERLKKEWNIWSFF